MNPSTSAEIILLFLIASSVKATLLLGLTGCLAFGLRQRSAAMRHHVWALGIVGSVVLPLLSLLLPSWHSTTLANAATFWRGAKAAAGNTSLPKPPSLTIDAVLGSPISGHASTVILVLWVLGALFVLMKLMSGLARLAWISARSVLVMERDWLRIVSACCQSLGINRPVQVLQSSDASAMPLTWGFFRPRILIPAGGLEWPPERQRVVLSHELAHVARHDWVVQICAELACGFYWFHPLMWFATARLRGESERACDDSALNSGIAASNYANQLLDLARTLKNAHRGWSAALAAARTSNLERRFIAMLNPRLNRSGLSPRARLLGRVAALCLLFPLAALRLPGQNVSGKFTGTIFDISDAAVPNATIIMTNHKSNTIDMTASDTHGNFAFSARPVGEYEMKVLKPGFAVYLVPQVELEPGRDSALTAKLNIGSLNESVDVQAEGSAKVMGGTETAAKAKPTRIRIGGNVEAAKVLTKVLPTYPEAAKAAGVQGSVVLHAVVGMDGKPMSLQVLNSQIDPELARAAVEAVSQWRYQPTLLNGEPVEVDTVITVNFTLRR